MVVCDKVPVEVSDAVCVDESVEVWVAVNVEVCDLLRVEVAVDVSVDVSDAPSVLVADDVPVLVREFVAADRVKGHQAKGSATTQRPSALHYCSTSGNGARLVLHLRPHLCATSTRASLRSEGRHGGPSGLD